MKPAPFDYRRATTIDDALGIVAEDPEAKILAGGQSLLALMNLRFARPTQLVDIGHLDVLTEISPEADRVSLGALVRHHRLANESTVCRTVPLLAEAARHVGHLAIRHRGTLGGSLAHADPAAELPAVMTTLGATLHVSSLARGGREVPAENFFRGIFTTALETDELVTTVEVRIPSGRAGWGFSEIARRPGDFAMMGAAALMNTDERGALECVRATVFGAAETPVLLRHTPPAHEPPPAEAYWGELAEHWLTDVTLSEDTVFRRGLARTALHRALRDAYTRAKEEVPAS